MFLKNIGVYFIITTSIILTCVTSGECLLCDTCLCKDSVINCTASGISDALNLSDHTEELKNIILLYFDCNNIDYVTQFSTSKANYLSLKHNKIKTIANFAFTNLKSLIELDLSYNYLTTENLKSEIFMDGSSNLVHLHLDYNDLHSLSAYVFRGLPNLLSLTLTGNKFKVIDRPTSFALSSLPMLKVLNLSNTSLSELPDHLLHTPRYLETLNLSKNQFIQIPQGLNEAHALQRLDLSFNPIKTITSFPKIITLKKLHLSHMPELSVIGPHAFSLLSNLEELHCSYNNKLASIDPSAFSYKFSDKSKSELWPPIVKLDLSYNGLGYLDSRLLRTWNTLEELNLQGNRWICDCENQWFVTYLTPMLESKHSNFLIDFTCQEPIEMSGISILDLDHRHYHMRCLDYYNNRPERDGILLVGILIGVILTVPFTMGIMMCCAKRKNSFSYYHRIFNQKYSNSQDYQLRETSIYQPTSIIADGY